MLVKAASAGVASCAVRGSVPIVCQSPSSPAAILKRSVFVLFTKTRIEGAIGICGAMLINATLAGLASCAGLAALPAGAPLLQPQRLSIARFALSRHLSPLYFSTGFASLAITRSRFSFFLGSVVALRSAAIAGISGQDASPVVQEENFTCDDAAFTSNRTPFNGAAISVAVGHAISARIRNSQFHDNDGGVGGAVYFASEGGALSVLSSDFARNSATAGAHAFLRCAAFHGFGSRWSVSGGGRSSIEVSDVASFSLDSNYFFRNAQPLLFLAAGNAVRIENACFLNYDDAPDYPETFAFFAGNAQLSIAATWINKRWVEAWEGPASEGSHFAALPTQAASGEECRMIPTPSATVDVQLNADAWFSIISIGFFVVVSVVGIIMVTCFQSAPPGEMILDRSDAEDRELEDVHE
jgi:hypothetical protein